MDTSSPVSFWNIYKTGNFSECTYYNCLGNFIETDHNILIVSFNPFNPHDALKHHFATRKNDLIS